MITGMSDNEQLQLQLQEDQPDKPQVETKKRKRPYGVSCDACRRRVSLFCFFIIFYIE